jgi:hypothetical protein
VRREIGPAGERGGIAFVDDCDDIRELRVRAGWWVNAIQLVCGPANVAHARHGGDGGEETVFRLQSGEQLKAISGSFRGEYGSFVFSLQIHTDRRSSAVFGNGGSRKGEVPFHLVIPSWGRFAGIVGRSGNGRSSDGTTGDYVHAIGLQYVVTGEQTPGRVPRPDLPTEIRNVIGAYASAINSRNIARLRAVHPTMTPQEQREFEQMFQSVSSLNVQLSDDRIFQSASTVEADVQGTYTLVTSSGSSRVLPVSFRMSFLRATDRWMISSVTSTTPPAATIRFVNRTEETVSIEWVNAGRSQVVDTIARGGERSESPRGLGRWAVLRNGTLIGFVRDSAPQRIEIVKRQEQAGPIFGSFEAAEKCGRVAQRTGSVWTGAWRTTVENVMSVCDMIFLVRL